MRYHHVYKHSGHWVCGCICASYFSHVYVLTRLVFKLYRCVSGGTASVIKINVVVILDLLFVLGQFLFRSLRDTFGFPGQ